MLDSNDLHRERDALHAHGGNVMRTIEGCRSGDAAYTTAVVKMNINMARNAAERWLQNLSKIEAECLLIAHQQDEARLSWRNLPDFTTPQALRRA